jgi:hypothetical protein
MPGTSHVHAVDMPWPRGASPAQPRPGPSSYQLSFAVATTTRQTRSLVLTPPVAADTIAIFPRPCRQSIDLARTQLAVPHLAITRASST